MKISLFKATVMVTVCCSKMFYSLKSRGALMWRRKWCSERHSWGDTHKSGTLLERRRKQRKKKIKIKTSVSCPPNTGHLYNSLCAALCRLSKGCSLFQFQWVPGTAPPSSSWNSPGCGRGGGNTRCANCVFNQQKIAGENDTFKANLP